MKEGAFHFLYRTESLPVEVVKERLNLALGEREDQTQRLMRNLFTSPRRSNFQIAGEQHQSQNREE
jgi:hypothetical protein